MSRFSELIVELCPNGVEYKPLEEVATSFTRGSGIKRDEVTADGVPCVRYGEIYTTYNIGFDTCISHTTVEVAKRAKCFEHGDILFAITGEKIEDIAKCTAYLGHDKCYAGGDVVVMKHEQNPKYLVYALSTEYAQRQKSKGKVKSKVVHSSVPALKSIVIPLPSIEVQNEVVRILDAYTRKVEELIDELESELAARQKQYEQYKERLIDYEETDDNIPMVAIGDCIQEIENIKWNETKRTYKYIELSSIENDTHRIGCLTTIDAKTAPSRAQQIVKTNDVLFGTTRPLLKRYCIVPEELTGQICSTGFCVLRAKMDMVLPSWLFYAVSTSVFIKQVGRLQKEGGYPAISNSSLYSCKIPRPSIPEQRRIVEILDKFDALCNDETAGLVAEIAARKKQYEYYRDRLLTFKRKESA